MIRAIVGAMAICALAAAPAAGSPSAQVPRAEHPRPDLRRDWWLSLNGSWQFCFDAEDRGLEEQWWALSEFEAAVRFDRQIVVPCCWQSGLPGPGEKPRAARIGWYRRAVRVPDSFGARHVWLCFGAVAEEARVWVNGHEAGQHEGGYEPFELDITPYARPGQPAVIVVRVAGAPDAEAAASDQPALWCGCPRGIWQSVYLEARPELYLDHLRLRPLRRAEAWQLEVELEAAGPEGPALVELASSDPAVDARRVPLVLQGGRARQTYVLAIRNPQPWSPESPHLYDLTISLGAASGAERLPAGEDRVHTYFGLRTIECARLGGAERAAVLLNGQPIYVRGAVWTGPNSPRLCTAQSDEFLRRQIELARQCGFNLLRSGAQPLEPRQLYWADRLGMLVWQEVPAAAAEAGSARAAWQRTLEALIRRDINHPSLIVWGLFYEDDVLGADWQRDEAARQWLRQMVQRAKTLDPSRLLVDRLAAWPAHLESDLRVWRFCSEEPDWQRRHLDRVATEASRRADFGCLPGSAAAGGPLICGEAALLAPDSSTRDVAFAFRHLVTQLRRHDVFPGFVYAALADDERQRGGLLDCQGQPKPFGYNAFVAGMEPADLLRADFVGSEGPAVIEAAPGERFQLPVFVSHYSTHNDPPKLMWYVVGVDDLGREVRSEPAARPVVWKPFGVTFQSPLEVQVPEDRPLVGAVCLELRDQGGSLLAANYVNLIARSELPAEMGESARDAVVGVEILGPRLAALRFAPQDYSALHPAPPAGKGRGNADTLVAAGHCEVEYCVALPPVLRDAVPARIVLLAEVATCAPLQRCENSPPGAASARAEVQARPWPGRLEIVLAGCQRTCWLPGDPADARGVLNWLSATDHCAYGYLLREVFDARDDPGLERALDRAPQLKLVLRATDGRGLRVYGAESGRYPIAPTLLVETAMDLHLPLGVFQRESAACDCHNPAQPEAAATH